MDQSLVQVTRIIQNESSSYICDGTALVKVYKPTLARLNWYISCRYVDVLIVTVANEAQADSVLYGEFGAVQALPSGATLILSSTVSPAFVINLEQRLINEGKELKLVDAPVSGGVKRAADGTLTIMASDTNEALECVGSVLSAMCAIERWVRKFNMNTEVRKAYVETLSSANRKKDLVEIMALQVDTSIKYFGRHLRDLFASMY
ncbi:L-threonate dehydrogenase [Linum perenne]